METHENKSKNLPISRRSALGLGAAAIAGSVLTHSVADRQGPATSPVPARRRFAGKVVIITGATSGIGRAAALAFAAEGARVGFCGRREALGREVEQEIKSGGGEATYVRADVRVEDDVKRFVSAVADK